MSAIYPVYEPYMIPHSSLFQLTTEEIEEMLKNACKEEQIALENNFLDFIKIRKRAINLSIEMMKQGKPRYAIQQAIKALVQDFDAIKNEFIENIREYDQRKQQISHVIRKRDDEIGNYLLDFSSFESTQFEDDDTSKQTQTQDADNSNKKAINKIIRKTVVKKIENHPVIGKKIKIAEKIETQISKYFSSDDVENPVRNFIVNNIVDATLAEGLKYVLPGRIPAYLVTLGAPILDYVVHSIDQSVVLISNNPDTAEAWNKQWKLMNEGPSSAASVQISRLFLKLGQLPNHILSKVTHHIKRVLIRQANKLGLTDANVGKVIKNTFEFIHHHHPNYLEEQMWLSIHNAKVVGSPTALDNP